MGRRKGKRSDLAGEEGWEECVGWNGNFMLRGLASSEIWEKQKRRRETENPSFQPNAEAVEVLVHLGMSLPA